MNVKRRYATITLIAVLVTIICIAAIVYTKDDRKRNEAPAGERAAYEYVLKSYDDRIGVFKSGEDKPFQTLDIYVQNLPVVDQYELNEGILVQDDKKLRMIIEDYEG